jgi:cell pole-organizing protein PopZ
MGDMSKEPSMEDILTSIKRIIAEEGEEAAQTVSRRGKSDAGSKQAAEPADPAVEEVLELTDEVEAEEPMPAHKTSRAPRSEAALEDSSILSVESEVAARHSLSALSSMLVTPKDGEDNTLDGLVRSMLKPLLKEWLDARLPALVEDMVAKEIARIATR